jgi:hypothetical protein
MLLRTTQHLNYINVPVCDRWKDKSQGFLNFLEDMGDRPEGCTLDRIDNSLGYEKDNCRWATSTVQNHNKRKITGSNNPAKGVQRSRDSYTTSIMKSGVLFGKTFGELSDAIVHYDNMSEVLYGDRPNGTVKSFDLPSVKRYGSVHLDSKSGKYRVRIMDLMGKRVTLGYFEDKEEADEIINLCIQLNLDFRLRPPIEQGAGYTDRHGT